MTTHESTVRKLAAVVEAVALELCEAVEAGQVPCPLQFDDREQWCLPCLAKQSLSEYMNG